MSASRDYAQRFTFADCFKNIFLVRSLLTSSPCNFKLNPNQNSPSFHNRRTLLFATNPPPLRHRDDEKSRHRRPQPTLRLPRDDKKSRHRRPPPAATSPPPLSHTGGDFILELKSYNNTEIKTKTMNRSKDNSSKLNSVFYAQNYHPIQAGSIDGTDVLPHDNAVYRALLCSSAGLYDPLGDPNVIGEDPYCTLFVGRLSHLITEDTLRQAMSKYGTVKNLRLVRHIVTGASRGYAFVEYESERDMHRAYEKAHHSIIDDSEIIVDYNRQQLMAGWIPRRLGGGLGGKKESGQLRFGGRERPFRAPLRPIPLDDLKRLGIPPPPEGNYMSRFEIPSPPRRKRSHAHREDKHSRSRRRSSSRDHAYDERRYADAEGGSWTSHRDDRSYYYDDEHERRSCSHDREDYSRKSRDSQSHRHDRTSTSHDHRRSDTKHSSDREQYDHGRSDMRRSSDREQCDHGRSDARRSSDREQHDHDRSDTRRSSDREQRDHIRSERRRSSDREQRDHGRSDTRRSSDRGQRSHKRHRHE